MKVFMTPTLSQAEKNNGIGQIIHAEYTYLPEYGIEFVDSPEAADVIACHAGTAQSSRVDVAHVHGLYWTGDPGSGIYQHWHENANKKILDTCRRARFITVPSSWVGECFRRDMRLNPFIVGHGIDYSAWQPGTPGGYVLWNKNRPYDVCDPAPAAELARRGATVWSTFGPKEPVMNLTLIGMRPWEEMKTLIQSADIYLATTRETFGIGTLEAMAAGVPILGYRWGGTADLVKHQVTGYLVEPGDIEGLYEGYEWLRRHRKSTSRAAREFAKSRDWSNVIDAYYHIYEEALSPESADLAVVITCHNYAAYIGAAIESVLVQTDPAAEIIVIDDGSTDASREVIARYQDRIRVIFQENKGVAAARNLGVELAKSPFIICLDADDLLAPEYIQLVRAALLSDRSLGVAYTGLTMLWENGQQTKGAWPPEFSWESQATPHVPPSNCVPCAAAFRRSMWQRAGGYRQEYAPGEDAEFWTRGLSLGFTAKRVTEEGLFIYRLHGGSASKTKRYVSIDDYLPWMRDKRYPMAAPAAVAPEVRSYEDPLISVIIPVGPGHERCVSQALDSLAGQTFREWEALVIDDTGSLELGEFLTPYPFAKWNYRQGPTQGAGAARNRGIDLARAPYVFFLDADDELAPDALQKMLELSQKSGRYVFSDYYIVENGSGRRAIETPEFDPAAYLAERQIHGVTALVPTEWARKARFDPELIGWEEYDYFMQLIRQGFCGTRLPEPLYIYRTALGKRRKDSQAARSALLRIFESRYPGGMTMPGCCGGNAGPILDAKRLIERNTEMVETVQVQPVPGMVRMEFVGDWTGPVTFKANGRVYQGANHPLYKYLDCPPEDAPILERTGKFRRLVVVAPTPEAIEPEKPQLVNATEIESGSTDIVENAGEKQGSGPDSAKPIEETKVSKRKKAAAKK